MTALIKPLDFTNLRFRASSVGKLCGKGKGKTPLEKYNDCVESIAKLKTQLDNTANKATKTYSTNYKKWQDKTAILSELEANKDKPYLSATAISYLIQVYAEARYGVKKNIYGKYLESGVAREPESISLLAEFDDELYESYKKWCIKNNKQYRQYNEFIEGECDILYPVFEPEWVIDVKSCWDVFTFQPHTMELPDEDDEDTEISNIIYKYQGISYCKLYNALKFKLAYCLVDMPDELIEDEIKRIIYSFGKKKEDSPECQEAINEFIRKCKFGHIPIEARVISFEVEYNEDDYNFMCGQIITAREWLNAYAIKEWERENRTKWNIITEDKALNEIAENEHNAAIKSITENLVAIQEVSVPVVQPCPNCQSTNYISYNEFNDKSCGDCGYDSDSGEIVITASQVTQKIFEEAFQSETPTPEPAPAPIPEPTPAPAPIKEETAPVIDLHNKQLLSLINECTSRDECVDLYVDKGAAFWQETENKPYYDLLMNKRTTFTVAPPPPPTPPTQPVKKESIKSDPTPPTPINNPLQPKPIYNIPTNNPQPGDVEKLAIISAQYPNFTTVQQYMDCYTQNKELIDRNLDFRSKYNEAGKNFSIKIAQQKRDELQRSITG